MTKINVTTKTSAEIDAVFDAIFQDVAPPRVTKPLTMADRIAPYRKAILKQRRRGLTWGQIAAGMADPRLGEKISASTLKRAFAAPRKGAAPTNPKTTARAPSASSPVANPSGLAESLEPRVQSKKSQQGEDAGAPQYIPPPRLVLDPLTRKPVTPVAKSK
jgi:hypothetical protein